MLDLHHLEEISLKDTHLVVVKNNSFTSSSFVR